MKAKSKRKPVKRADRAAPRVPLVESVPTPRWPTFVCVALITLAVVAVYANSLSGVFVFDDERWIERNPTIRDLGDLKTVLFPANPLFDSGRPLMNLFIAVNYAVSGLDVRGYHAVNIAIHWAAAVLLLGVARRTLLIVGQRSGDDASQREPTYLALAIALLWAVHPLQTAAVDYIIQRTEALVSLFYLLTLYAVIRGSTGLRRAGWYLLAVIACALGMATKEVMVTAPVVVWLYDRTFLSGSFVGALRQRWPVYLAMTATWSIIAWGLISTNFHHDSTGLGTKEFTPVSYALTQPGVIVYYLASVFWPSGLSLDHAWPAVKSAGQILLPTLLVVTGLAATVWMLVKRLAAGFLAATFFLLLAPTSTIVPIRDAAVDHRMYLASSCVIALVVLGCWQLWLRLEKRLGAKSAKLRLIPVAAMVLAIVALGAGTVFRNRVYDSEVEAWRDVVVKAPQSPRAHHNVSVALRDDRQLDEALRECREALSLNPNYSDAINTLGSILLLQGQVDQSIPYFERVLDSVPNNANAAYMLGLAYRLQHKYMEALPLYVRALQIWPRHTPDIDALAQELADRGYHQQSLALCRLLIDNIPRDADAYYLLGECLRKGEQPEQAIAAYEQALRWKPDYAAAHRNLAGVLAKQKRYDEATKHYRRAMEIEPNVADDYFNLGMIAYAQSSKGEAERYWREAVRLSPRNIQYLRPLAWLLATSPDRADRDGAEAVRLAGRAVECADQPDPTLLATLAAAYAENGQTHDAVKLATEALGLAEARGDVSLATQLRERLELYRSGRPYREPR